MALSDYSDEELQEELEKRQKLKDILQPLDNIDYSSVYASAVEYMAELSESGREPKDCQQHMYEDVMEAVYGKKVWDYINKILV
jgi:predicted membrane GTPase involved in stress response